MHVQRLQLTGFRGYRELDLSLPTGPLLFLGDNAQGKSNLLEAVQLLATGRSVRAGSDSEMIAWDSREEGQAFARLQAGVERRASAVQLETLIVAPGAAKGAPSTRAGKRFRVNGIPRRAVDFVGQLRAVLFTADDLAIVSGAPAVRRLFLDVALTQLDRGYYGALQRYGRILQQRNASLRRIRDGVAGQDELLLWEDSLAKEGATLISSRERLVRRLAERAGESHRELSGAAAEELALAYEPALGEQWRSVLQPDSPPATVQSLFAAALAGGRRRDIAAGVSLIGPHRDDVSILLDGVSAASFGSRAQIRTASLALRLAESRVLAQETRDPPVLLLDDIVSELDERRRRSVLGGIADFDQVWLTATDAAGLPAAFVESCTVFRVRHGEITAPD